MVMPIPKSALPHSCVLSSVIGKDVWGKEEITQIELSHVRIEPCRKKDYSLQNELSAPRAKLFFDAVNSLPQGIEFVTGDKITFFGTEYTITEAAPYYADTSKLHHWEVLLS